MPTALDVVDGEVRELIRRRGLDPFIDPGPVRVLVRDVVADYSERSLTSALPPIGDAESIVRDVLDRVAGFGPLQRYLDDPEIEEIWVNEPGRVFIARRGRSELTTTILAPGELADLVERMLRTSGRRIDMSTPFVDATMPDGSRLHAANVVVLRVDVQNTSYVDPAGNPVPETVMVGEGDALVATGAHTLEVQWSKASTDAPVILSSTSGGPVRLAPGSTWIELAPSSTEPVVVR